MFAVLKALLAHPLTRRLDIDDPQATDLRRRIIREKKFLKLIYEDWYTWIVSTLPPGRGPVVELGPTCPRGRLHRQRHGPQVRLQGEDRSH